MQSSDDGLQFLSCVCVRVFFINSCLRYVEHSWFCYFFLFNCLDDSCLIDLFVSSCHEKATEALYIGRIQTRLVRIVFTIEFMRGKALLRASGETETDLWEQLQWRLVLLYDTKLFLYNRGP